MNVPLDRLYHFLEDINGEDMLIYRFFPHGSKNLKDLKSIRDVEHRSWADLMTTPAIIYHDQEPLNFDLYQPQEIWDVYYSHSQDQLRCQSSIFQKIIKDMHLRSRIKMVFNCYDKVLLCHSEKNSAQLDRYQENGFLGVYWWSHAMIARDWFRYAEFDRALIPNFDCIVDDFLIYNRAWSGSREYRLFFASQLIQNDLLDNCFTSFSPWDNSVYYQDHQFVNDNLKPEIDNLEKYFRPNNTTSFYSADYYSPDYQHIAIEVVLETLFDDLRWHLTEKSLRPIACGRPFMLAATAGSLRYLQSYGFETFGNYIDESYDTITDPVDRILCIQQEMKRISQLPQQQKTALWQSLYAIARKNQQLFFSSEWINHIVEEYRQNFTQAHKQLKQQYNTAQHWRNYLDTSAQNPVLAQHNQTLPREIQQQIIQLNSQLNINQ